MTTPISEVVRQAGQIVLGKDREIRLALACLLARGHLLIEDLPGIGKTTLAQTLARLLGLDFQRVQFTSDLLPGDVLGVSVWDRQSGAFSFHHGPIFTQVLLVDEINRATPKTQSALLEAMEEGQVSIEGQTRPLPRPFLVIATQNPMDQSGTFPLPESQLDRFLMRLTLGYPDRDSERELLQGSDRRTAAAALTPCMDAGLILAAQEQVDRVHLSDPLVAYVQDLLDFTRRGGHFLTGLSPRAGLALIHSARAWAFIQERDFVLPEDIQAVIPLVVGHRLQPVPGDLALAGRDATTFLVHSVPIP